MKRVLPIVMIAVIAAGVFFYVRQWREAEARHQLTFSGNIELTEVRMAFKRPDRLNVRNVDEGDTVTSGAVIARLDTDELERQRERAAAALAIAESQLSRLDYEIRFSEESSSATIGSSLADLAQAKATHRELADGSRKQEIAEAQAAADRAKTEAAQAERDWIRIRGLYESGVVSVADRDAARTRLETSQAGLEQARQNLSLVREGPRRERIEAAQAAVQRSQAGLRGAKASEIELELKRLERPIRYAQVQSARADLALTDTQLAESVLRAPLTGVVLTKSAEPGEVLAAGTPVVTLGDLDHPWARAYISEEDLGRVRLGDPVRVTTDSFPGKVYGGRVSFIASEAEFTPKQIQTREERTKWVYRIKIDVENPNHELKLNMPVEGQILPGGAVKP
jgi:HlyD family secretion protein